MDLDVELCKELLKKEVIQVKNGNDSIACSKAIASAKHSNKPTIIIFKTINYFSVITTAINYSYHFPTPLIRFLLFQVLFVVLL